MALTSAAIPAESQDRALELIDGALRRLEVLEQQVDSFASRWDDPVALARRLTELLTAR